MLQVRIGNDITIRATVTRQGEAEDFTGKTLTLVLRSPYERIELPYIMTGNTLTATWLGSSQTKTGIYTLTLIEDYGEGSRNTVTAPAFILSPAEGCGCNASALTGAQTVCCDMEADSPTSDVSLNITAPANGLSAYEIAQQYGFEGTEEEWVASLKGKDGKDGVDGKDGANGANGTIIAPYFGTVTNKSLAKADTPPIISYVAWDSDTGRFVGCVQDAESGIVVIYPEWTATGILSPDNYGTATDTGRKPDAYHIYLDIESNTLSYFTASGEMSVIAGSGSDVQPLTEEEIDAISQQ